MASTTYSAAMRTRPSRSSRASASEEGWESPGESEAAKGSTANPGERGPETGVPCRSEWKRWRSRRRGTPDELTGRSPVGGET